MQERGAYQIRGSIRDEAEGRENKGILGLMPFAILPFLSKLTPLTRSPVFSSSCPPLLGQSESVIENLSLLGSLG